MAQSRKLAAILAADIAGYSALMGADEARTVGDLKGHQAVVLPMVGAHGGRIIDTAGDGILAEFASVVNAVECAAAIQKTMAERNAAVDSARRMQFRIGINIGDVIYDEARIYGDGINIAARLEGIAEPGGVCVSAKVYDEIDGKLALAFKDLGEHQLKNIARPVKVYAFTPSRPTFSKPDVPPTNPLRLPDKPSIAILPFANMSNDPGQDYFSDGISEDIITELSRFSELFVIARNSSFQYKGKSPDTRQVGRELGVRYVLEGSIRRAAERVRITTQLVDTATGTHHWAERYDRELKDVFAVQDDVVRSIVALLAVHLNKAEAERAFLKPPADWQAYDFCMRAIYLNASFFPSAVNVEIIYEMRKLLEQALAIDPNYARAKALLADSYVSTAVNPLDDDYLSPSVLNRAHELARVAVQLDPRLAEAHASLGRVLLWKRQHEASIAEFERAAALNPNIADWRFAACLTFAGQPARAVEFFETNMHRDPYYSSSPLIYVGLSLYGLRRYADALSPFREAAARLPDFRACHVMLAATYGQLGQIENAQAEAAEVLRIDPTFTTAELRCILPFKRQEDADHFFEGLGAAGLPER